MKQSLGSKTIVYPTPVFIVGSYDSENKPNMMTAAWGGICCSAPAAVTVSIRKQRYSYENILNRKAFTISIPSEKYMKEADYFGLVSGKSMDKLSVTGLNAKKAEFVDAPYIEEFPFVVECSLVHTFDVGAHTMFIGEIKDVKVDEDLIGDENITTIEKVKPIMFAPDSCTYHGIGKNLGDAFKVGQDFKK